MILLSMEKEKRADDSQRNNNTKSKCIEYYKTLEGKRIQKRVIKFVC